jgi:beta-lactamase class D
MEKSVSGRRLHEVAGFLYSMGLAGLGLLGMTGLVYHALAPDGWFTGWLGRLWSQHPAFALLVLIGLLTTALAARNQVGRQRFERGSTEAPFYFFIALGTLFAGRLLVYGTL